MTAKRPGLIKHDRCLPTDSSVGAVAAYVQYARDSIHQGSMRRQKFLNPLEQEFL